MGNRYNGVLEDPKSLQLFLYCKQSDNQISIRQAQRDLGITSSSSVHWHLNKLVTAGLVEQDNEKMYQLTERGRSIRSVSLPVQESFIIVNNQLMPIYIFQLSFLISSVIIAGFFTKYSNQTALIFLFFVVITELIMLINKIRKVRSNKIMQLNRS